MKKISLWTLGLIVTASIASIGVFGQTPTHPEVQSSTQTPSNNVRRTKRKDGAARLAKLDANRDGKISQEEWPRKAEVFARLDSNSDGELTAAEMRSGKQGRGHRGRKAFGKMDQNNDEQITREEWKGRAEVFDRLDANGDGIVRADEVKGRRQKGQREPR